MPTLLETPMETSGFVAPVLRCQKCGLEQPRGPVVDYLRNGFPTHCGLTMESTAPASTPVAP